MSEMRDEILRTLDRIVEDTVSIAMREATDQRASLEQAAGGAIKPGSDATAKDTAGGPLWAALDEVGLTALGGGGDDDVTFSDAMAVVRRTGYHALPVPLAETIVARRMLAKAGIAAPAGAITIAPPGAGSVPTADGRGGLSGHVEGLPYGRSAAHAVVASRNGVHLLAVEGAVSNRGMNAAGEPRDRIDGARAKLVAHAALADAVNTIETEGALMRAVQLAGAMAAVLDHALVWVNDRVQFGKPIAKHQAVQHLMAQLATETAAAGAAADLAIEACETEPNRFAIAVAKSRTGEAAGKGANIAHAVFGAMGFTREHALHYSTRRLWAWRNEFGAETYWQSELGRMVAAGGGSGLWPMLTQHGQV